ncbi:Trehalase family protein [Aphelenchoides avenae]|nr:Trehalase family protein [Aphelenchus avenae]
MRPRSLLRSLLPFLTVLHSLVSGGVLAFEEPDVGHWLPIYEHGVEVFEDVATVHMCDGNDTTNWFIYCAGPILEAVNYHKLFNDSKDFVDMPLKMPPEEVQHNFDKKFGSTNVQQINADALKDFIEAHFSPPGAELENCTPADWKENPGKLMSIQDPEFREWALQLNGLWKHLCKKIKPEIYQAVNQYSLIAIPNEFIAPGGRFREFYYWDAYWIIKGLLASEMYDTSRQMILNFKEMVDRFGFIPNGGRVYYLRRSQPPLLTPMVYEYYEATHNKSFLNEILPTLEKELKFWDTQRTVKVKLEDGRMYKAYRYRTSSNVPRPESFKEDMETSIKMNDTERQFFYRAVASAAESGWDFSTRWFRDRKTLASVETHKVLPVDLNSYICWNLDILEYLYEQVANYDKSVFYRDRRAGFRQTVEHIFYNDTTGSWHDYNLRSHKHNTEFYPLIAVPLFTNCYNDLDQQKSERLYEFMEAVGAFSYPGGVPSSQIRDTGEQWDFPNGWSPSQHILIEGLRKSENPKMQDQAFKIAKKWVYGNYKVFSATHHMWEKYNVIGSVPAPGHGGEYTVQDGFGWTNGVILDLLVTYKDRLRWETTDTQTTTQADTRSTRAAVSGQPDVQGNQGPPSSTPKAASRTQTFSVLVLALTSMLAVVRL